MLAAIPAPPPLGPRPRVEPDAGYPRARARPWPVVLGVWRGFAGSELVGVLACLGAVACYGVAFPYSRRYLAGSGEGPLALATAQVLLAAGLMLPVVVLTGAAPTATVTPTVVAAMLAPGALRSGVAYVLDFRIVAAAGASTASSVTYLTPVVAAVVG